MSEEIDTSKIDAVKNDGPEYTPAQLYRIAAVYQYLAQMLPTEGRDYRVTFGFPEGTEGVNISVKFEPITGLGKVWCDYCEKMLRAQGGTR